MISNSMVQNPKLVALLERVAEHVIRKKANGMTGDSMILNSAVIEAANDYGVDLHEVEHAIEFSGDEHPVVLTCHCRD